MPDELDNQLAALQTHYDAIAAKESGNLAAKNGNWEEALKCYEQCLQMMSVVSIDADTVSAVRSNASLACRKLWQIPSAIVHADAAVAAKPGHHCMRSQPCSESV